jgi:hypothetical protein
MPRGIICVCTSNIIWLQKISIPVEILFTCRNLLNRSPIHTHTTIPDLHVVDDIPIPIEYSYEKDLVFLHASIMYSVSFRQLENIYMSTIVNYCSTGKNSLTMESKLRDPFSETPLLMVGRICWMRKAYIRRWYDRKAVRVMWRFTPQEHEGEAATAQPPELISFQFLCSISIVGTLFNHEHRLFTD